MHGQLTSIHQPGSINKLASQASFKNDIPTTIGKRKKDILTLPKAVMLMHRREQALGAKQKAGRKRKAVEVVDALAKRVAPRTTPHEVTLGSIKAAKSRRKADKRLSARRQSRRANG